MYTVWVLNLLARPAMVMAHVTSRDKPGIERAAAALAVAFPGPEFTLVHEVNSQPLGLEEPGG